MENVRDAKTGGRKLIVKYVNIVRTKKSMEAQESLKKFVSKSIATKNKHVMSNIVISEVISVNCHWRELIIE